MIRQREWGESQRKDSGIAVRMLDVIRNPHQSMFVYASGPDAGADVPEDAIVLPWGADIPPDQARDLADILGAYARDKGWEWMQVGDTA